ncbi:MAG: glycosyltransferase family 4 protein [Deltaproteobacteria bacterium]|jgi:glycosyltransferase involved in cell wall biosynthesis|nr:glycosyltransferase family 4 protein [Deltaproteobacteria bacterium]
MKTLAIDCRMARMSGIGVYLRNLAPRCMALLAGEARFRLLGYDGAFAVPEGCRWEDAPFGVAIYSLAEQMRILPLLRGCDALWTPHYPIPVLSRLPLAVTVHDVAHLALADAFTTMQKAYARLMFQSVRHKAAELVFDSEFSRQEFLRHVGRPRGGMTVVHLGVDSAWAESFPAPTAASAPYFLAVGNIKPHKNIRLLCRAFARIADSCDAKLVLAGEHSGFRTSETSTDILAEICPGRIRFTGAVEQKTLISLVAGAQALIFPSRYEGFGLPPLEALAAGVPVAASDIPPVREVCAEHVRYFSPDNEAQLSQALCDMLALSPEERRAQGEAGRAHARRFSWEAAACKTVEILRRVLGASSRL